MKILSKCLYPKSISPYQTSDGVEKESGFFGRIEIVRDIKQKSNINYMIVGGRQLGKTSILKKLERGYKNRTDIECHFISMETLKGDIILAIAQALKMADDSTLADVVDRVYHSDKKMIFLIDEVDEFIEPEIKRDYEVTKAFRRLSQEGKATFILAGYWTLYSYVTADYQSPLYNFGKLVILEGLEQEACKSLMVEPMEKIGISYENDGFPTSAHNPKKE